MSKNLRKEVCPVGAIMEGPTFCLHLGFGQADSGMASRPTQTVCGGEKHQECVMVSEQINLLQHRVVGNTELKTLFVQRCLENQGL